MMTSNSIVSTSKIARSHILRATHCELLSVLSFTAIWMLNTPVHTAAMRLGRTRGYVKLQIPSPNFSKQELITNISFTDARFLWLLCIAFCFL